MKIVKCSVEEYLVKWCGFSKSDLVGVDLQDEDEVYELVNDDEGDCFWDYPLEEIGDLLEKENEFRKESGNELWEDVYVYLFDRLWEVSNDILEELNSK